MKKIYLCFGVIEKNRKIPAFLRRLLSGVFGICTRKIKKYFIKQLNYAPPPIFQGLRSAKSAAPEAIAAAPLRQNNRLRPLPFQRPRAKLAAAIPLPALRPQFAIAGGGMRPHSVFR